MILVLFLFVGIMSIQNMSPEHFGQHFHRRAQLRGFKSFVTQLGRTINNNPISAYAITGIDKVHSFQDIQNHPGALLTAFFDPNEVYTFSMLVETLERIISDSSYDDRLFFMLKKTVIWVIPYVNMDSFILRSNTPPNQQSMIKKNQNGKKTDCLSAYSYGVNINRNFGHDFGQMKQSSDICSMQYRGASQFSQRQSKAIKGLFQKYHITLAIDIRSYGNYWIYPYASDTTGKQIKGSHLYPQYEFLVDQLKKNNMRVMPFHESMYHAADGTYIDWVLDQGVLGITYFIGRSVQNDPLILDSIQSSLQGFYTVLKQNSYLFSVYKTPEKKLYIQSNSLIDVQIQIYNGQNSQPEPRYLFAQQSFIGQIWKIQQQIKIKVIDSSYEQIFYFKDLEEKQLRRYIPKKNNKIFKKIISNAPIFIFLLIIVGLVAYTLYQNLKKQKNKKIQLKSEDDDHEQLGKLKTDD